MSKSFRSMCVVLAILLCVFGQVWAGGQQDVAGEAAGKAPRAELDGDIDYIMQGLGLNVSTNIKANEKYTIACVVKNSTNPYMVKQLEGMRMAGEMMGFEAVTLAPAKQDNIEEQVRIVEDLIQSGVDGIVIHPSDSNGIVPVMEKAMSMGIPVAIIGTPANTDEYTFRTGVDYYETGVVVGEYVAENLGGKGKVIILEGPPQAQNAHERNEGILESFSKYPGIEVIASQTGNFRRLEGMTVMENLIQQFGDGFDAVVAHNDEMAMGASMAIEAAGISTEDKLIAGFDCNQDASYAIQKGSMDVSYNTDPISSAVCGAAYIVQYLNDGTLPATAFIPYPAAAHKPLVTANNIDNFIENVAWWK